ncbi:unnamed protein product [Blumeria hordei]|uniref:Ribonuclease P protein subunit n=1 Tax=Blumeria hordei TaxID=2867405 RepID=A0A383UIW7_BLUHO|nr:unnamed protein product [Blumeria hordei]
MAPKQQPIALALLSRAHSPETATRIYTDRVLHRPLHVGSSKGEPTAQQIRREERIRKRLARTRHPGRPAPLSCRRARALDLYTIPPTAQKYALYVPLNRLWISYIQEVLWDSKIYGPLNSTHAAKLCSADFHGAELEVVRSKCVSRVGVRGIVVKDTRGVFELVTPKDEIKILPKEGTIFRFQVPIWQEESKDQLVKPQNASGENPEEKTVLVSEGASQKSVVFELHGDQFQHRAADRANRKVKPHYLPNL